MPEATREWNPEIAPHAIVMNANGNSLPANTGPSPAVANGVSAGLTRKLAPRPGASGVSKAPTKAVVPGKGVLRPAGSTLAVKETRMLLVDGATNPLLGKPAKSVGWINAGGEPVSQVNVFAKRTAQENHALFGGVQQQIAKNQAAQRQQLLHEFQDEYAIRQDF